MIFVWSRFGFLVVPVVLATFMAVAFVLERLLGYSGHLELMSYAFALAIIAGAGTNWFVGRKLNSKPPRELVDPKTQETVLLRRRHTFFWIPMQYWSFPVAAIGLLMLLVGGSHAASLWR